MRHRAWVASVLVGLVACLGVGGFAAAATKQAGGRLAGRFQDGEISFRYPRAWRALACGPMLTSFTEAIVFLSSASPAPACASFGWPDEQLREDGVLVMWWQFGEPRASSIRRFPGKAFRVGGEPARIAVQAPSAGSFAGGCSTVAGTRTVNVAFKMPQAADNWYRMTACLRGPDFLPLEAKLRAMLASVRLEGHARTVAVSGYVRLCGGPAPGHCFVETIGVCRAPKGCVVSDRVRVLDADGRRVAQRRLHHARFRLRLRPGTYRFQLLGDGKLLHGQVMQQKTVMVLAHQKAVIRFSFAIP